MSLAIDKGFGLTNHQHGEREMFTEDVRNRLDPAEEYHCASKLYPSTAYAQLAGLALLQTNTELQFRTRHAWRRNLDQRTVSLAVSAPLSRSLGEAIRNRRSAPEFSGAPLSANTVGSLLDAANGILERSDPLRSRRAAPSGGGLYPIDLYVYAIAVEGLPTGFYYYNPPDHSLVAVAGADGLHEGIFAIPVTGGSFSVMMVAAFWRTRFKYGLRGYRFALLEAGHIAQNFLLAAGALNVECFPCGSTYDDNIDRLLGLDGVTEGVVYCIVAGSPKGG